MNKKVLKNLGKRLKYFRKKVGISQEYLAKLVQVNHSYISKIETGKSIPSLLLIYKLTGALNISPYEFFNFRK